MNTNKIYILNRKQETIGIMSNDLPKAMAYWDDVYTDSIDGNVSTFEFKADGAHPTSSLLEVGNYILYIDIDGKKQLFEIVESGDTHNNTMTKSVYCEHTIVTDLIGNIVKPTEMKSWSLKSAITHVLNGTGVILGTIEYDGNKDMMFDTYITSLQGLHQIMQNFDVEMEYDCEFNGTKVVNKIIHVVKKRGRVTGKEVKYNRNMNEITKEVDSRGIATAMYGVGKDRRTLVGFNDAENFLEEGFKFNKEDGYIYHEEAFQRWNINGKHIFDFYEDSEVEAIPNLFQRTLEKLKENCKPKSTYTVSMVDLERLSGYEHFKMRTGDYIKVKDFEYREPLVLEARIIETKRSKTNPNADQVVLGDFRPLEIFANDKIDKLQQIIKDNQARWDEAGEKIIKSPTPPTNPNVGQLWIDESDEQNIMRKWNGYGWEEVGALTTDELEELENIISDIDDRTQETAIIGLVTANPTIQGMFNQKVDTEDIADFATSEQLEGVKAELNNYIDNRIDYTLDEVNVLNSKIEKSFQDIRMEFTSAKGVNLLRNSIGFADTDFWSATGTINTRKDEEMEALGYGSGWFSSYGESGYIEQIVKLEIGKHYTLSFLMNKTRDSLTQADSLVEIDIDGATIASIGSPTGQGVTNGFMFGKHTFEATSNQVVIRVKFGINCESTVTALMLNDGEQEYAWNHHSEEIYNTNILFNQLGIRVKNINTGNHVQITPEEFSGYADVDGQMEKIFTLNGSQTQVHSLQAKEEINLSPVKMKSIKSTNRNGIAFIPSEG